MGPSEVSYFRSKLPQLRIAGGFFDMAPLAETIASSSVLNDVLVKEKDIFKQCDDKQLKKVIKSIPHIDQTYIALYSVTNCNDQMYYYNTKGVHSYSRDDYVDERTRAGTHFVDFKTTFDCSSIVRDINSNIDKVMKYYRGDIPVPENTRSSELRDIYSFVRHHSDCLNKNHVLNGDRLLMLVFEQNVRLNFLSAFKDKIVLAEDAFKLIGESLQISKKSYKIGLELKKEKTESGEKIKGIGVDFSNVSRTIFQNTDAYKKLKEKFAQESKNIFHLDSTTLKSKSRKDIIKMIGSLNAIIVSGIKYAEHDKQFGDNLSKLRSLSLNMESYLYQMNPRCMNALRWHEYTPGNAPPIYVSCRL